jgi:DNA-binding NarL/FixJ family response regulator
MPIEPTPVTPVTSNGSPPKRIQVLLVDDHPAVRVGARQLLDEQPDMAVIGEASSAEQALRLRDLAFDVAVVDYHLGNGQDGLWLTAELKRMEHPPRVLVYSAFADNALAVIALIAGADGLLDKGELGEGLCLAIRRLARGHQHLPALSSPLVHALRSRLAPRDQAIFGMLLHGIQPKTIAERLGITRDELSLRRSIILRSLRPAPSVRARRSRTGGPLDYERPRRLGRRWSA